MVNYGIVRICTCSVNNPVILGREFETLVCVVPTYLFLYLTRLNTLLIYSFTDYKGRSMMVVMAFACSNLQVNCLGP